MLPAANSLLIAPAPQPRPSPVNSADDSVSRLRTTLPVFEGITEWPYLDQLLFEKSVELIGTRGINEWALAGGTLRPNGIPALGSPSVPAYRLLRDTIENHPGFWYSDDFGTKWAVTVSGDSSPGENSWSGLALGFSFPPHFTEPRIRRQKLARLSEERSSRRQYADSLGPGVRARPVQCELSHRRLEQIEHCMKLIPLLRMSAEFDDSMTSPLDPLRLASALWGKVQADWPAAWRDLVFEAVSRLGDIWTLEIELPKTGWVPVPRHRGRVLQSVNWHPSGELFVRVDPIFIRFFDLWSSGGKSFRDPKQHVI